MSVSKSYETHNNDLIDTIDGIAPRNIALKEFSLFSLFWIRASVVKREGLLLELLGRKRDR